MDFKKIGIFILSLLLFVTAQAQDAQWGLQQCVDYALQNNLDVKIQQLSIEDNKALFNQSRFARMPNLNGFVSHDYNWGRSFDVFTNAPITERVRSNNFSINANLTLFNGMQNQNSIVQNRQNVEASQADLEKTKNDLMLNVVSAYLQILFDTENLNNAQRLLLNTEEQIERTEKLVNGGVLPETNLLDLLSQKASDEVQVINSENALTFSVLRLKQLLQLSDDEPFDIVIPDIADPATDVLIEGSETIYRTAEATLPEIKSADLNVQSTETGIKIAQGGYFPTLSMSAGINTSFSSAQEIQVATEITGVEPEIIGFVELPGEIAPELLQSGENTLTYNVIGEELVTELVTTEFPFWDQLDESLRQSIGFSLNIPIYNRHQVKTGVNRSKIQYEQARLNAQLIRNQLRQNIETARQDALAANKTFAANTKRLEALQETFRVTETQFNIGTANITDYNVARNNLVNAQSDLLRAKFDYIFKMKVLDFYLGKEMKL